MKKSHIVSIVFLVLGVGCFSAYHMIDSEVMPDGRLVEPFGLIPIGWLLIIIGVAVGIYSLLKKK